MPDPYARNGFSIRSWNDVLSVLAIITLLSSALAWGLTLQYGKEDHERRITTLENSLNSLRK